MRAHGHAAFALSEEERIQFAASLDRLAGAGATITRATDFYLAKHRALKKAMTLRELLDACVLDKELASASNRYLTQFASSCRSFLAGSESMVASEVTRDVVKLWILGKGLAPKTQRTYLGDVRTPLAWAKQERYIAENPIAEEEGFIKFADEADREIEALTVEDCGKLLWTALFGVAIEKTRAGTGRWVQQEAVGGFRVLIGYIAVAMFTGVRPDVGASDFVGDRDDLRIHRLGRMIGESRNKIGQIKIHRDSVDLNRPLHRGPIDFKDDGNPARSHGDCVAR